MIGTIKAGFVFVCSNDIGDQYMARQWLSTEVEEYDERTTSEKYLLL